MGLVDIISLSEQLGLAGHTFCHSSRIGWTGRTGQTRHIGRTRDQPDPLDLPNPLDLPDLPDSLDRPNWPDRPDPLDPPSLLDLPVLPFLPAQVAMSGWALMGTVYAQMHTHVHSCVSMVQLHAATLPL